MNSSFVHVLHWDGIWIVEEEPGRLDSTHDSQEQAILAGQELAKQKRKSVVVHTLRSSDEWLLGRAV